MTGPYNYIGYAKNNTAVSLILGSPGPWVNVNTVSYISVAQRQGVKIDVSLQLAWTSSSSGTTELTVDYRVLRNGTVVYSNTDEYGFSTDAKMINNAPVDFFYVDTPDAGAYTYTLQARVKGNKNLDSPAQVLNSDMSVIVFNNAEPTSYLYVSYTPDGEQGSGKVAVIDPATDKVLQSIAVGSNPGALAKTPDGTTVYVVNSGDNTVSVIDTYSSSVIATIPVGTNPVAVLVAPDNSKAYVANYDSSDVTIIDNATKQVIKTVPVGGKPFSFTASPRSWFIFAACKVSDGKDFVSAISISDDSAQTFGSGLTLNAKHNPVAISADSETMFIFSTALILKQITGPNKLGWGTYLNSVHAVSGVFLDNDNYAYMTQQPSSTIMQTIKLWMNQYPAYYYGPWNLNSYKGQNKIVLTPDQSKVCVSIVANDDQFAGLQVIDTSNNKSQFIELPIAHDVVVTTDSAKAYVTEDEYVHPVDIVNYTPISAIAIGGTVHGLVAAYRTQT